MLDDLKLIHERDAQDTLGVAAGQWQQLEHPLVLSGGKQFGRVHNVVYAAMGGSALGILLSTVWPKIDVPLEIVRDYDLPSYVDAKTLVVVASYSGNTEETLSALEQAEAKGAQIAVITGGGKLQQVAQEKGYSLVLLPRMTLPRCATFYNFRAALEVFVTTGLLKHHDFEPELSSVTPFLREAIAAWLPDVPTANNPAKQLAQELIGKSIVMYSGPKMYPAAYKWKLNFNENAKQLAWINQLPEFSHNEMMGWTKQPTDKPYVVIELHSGLEHPRIQRRLEVGARLLSGLCPEAHIIDVEGDNVVKQMMWSIVYGDFVSLYLAILNGLNPMPLEMVDKLKQALSE